jgi:hypothetical protein
MKTNEMHIFCTIIFHSLPFLQHVSASCHLQGEYITLLYKTLKTLKYVVSAIIKIFLKC